MGTLTLEQRCYIEMKFKDMFGKDLRDLIKSECGKRDFGFALDMIAIAPHLMECSFLRTACKVSSVCAHVGFVCLCALISQCVNLYRVSREK